MEKPYKSQKTSKTSKHYNPLNLFKNLQNGPNLPLILTPLEAATDSKSAPRGNPRVPKIQDVIRTSKEHPKKLQEHIRTFSVHS